MLLLKSCMLMTLFCFPKLEGGMLFLSMIALTSIVIGLVSSSIGINLASSSNRQLINRNKSGSRSVHGSDWVGLREFFDLTYYDGLKKIQSNSTHHISPTQPNPTHMGQVEPIGWTIFFITIINKLSKKKYKYKYIKKIQRLVLM